MSSFKKKEIVIDLYKFLDRGVEFVWFSPGPLKLTDGLICAHNYDGFMLGESFTDYFKGRKYQY